jgi:hypothetical protein
MMLSMSNTLQHVRLLLDSIDPDARFVDDFRSFLKSPPRKTTDHDDFQAWCLTRIKELSGATSFKDAFQNDDVRTLLAFGYMGYAQHLNLPSLRVTQSMPVPKVASTLEPDFFPVLLKEIRSHAELSAPFANNLQAGEKRVLDLVNRLSAAPPPDAPAAADGLGESVIGLVTFLGFLVWATLSLDKKKK